jgi:hypothetical protein
MEEQTQAEDCNFEFDYDSESDFIITLTQQIKEDEYWLHYDEILAKYISEDCCSRYKNYEEPFGRPEDFDINHICKNFQTNK